MSAHAESRGRRDIPLDGNAAPLLPRFRRVVGELYPQQADPCPVQPPFDTQGHFCCQSGLATEKARPGYAPHLKTSAAFDTSMDLLQAFMPEAGQSHPVDIIASLIRADPP